MDATTPALRKNVTSHPGSAKSDHHNRQNGADNTKPPSQTVTLPIPNSIDYTYPNQATPEIRSFNITSSFTFLRWILLVLLRFPFSLKKSSPEDHGSLCYHVSNKSVLLISFLGLNIFLTIILLLCTLNYFGLLLDFPKQDANRTVSLNGMNFTRVLHAEENYLVHRNISAVITLFSQLVHVVLSGWKVFAKRDFLAKYLTFWYQAANMISVDVGKDLKKFMTIVSGLFLCINGIIVLNSILGYMPITSGSSAIFTILSLRTFYPPIHASSSFGIFRSIFSILFLYIGICSHLYMIFYLFQCKLLANAIREWNRRLEFAILKAPKLRKKGIPEISSHVRTEYNNLYQDYHCIVNLIEGTDKAFEGIIESYYGAQVMSISFQLFHLYNAVLNRSEFTSYRRLDCIALIISIVQALTIVFFVAKSAATVGNHALEGIELIRQRGMLGKKTDEEAYFMLSMRVSYSGYFPTALTGGKFFALDQPFILSVAATIFTYVILIIQFTYIFKGNFEKDKDELITKQKNSTVLVLHLLKNVEGIWNPLKWPDEDFRA